MNGDVYSFIQFNYFLSSALPQISSLQLIVPSGTALTLKCTSTSSPPANVIWSKDGASLSNNSSYETVQILRNGMTATYDNYLLVNGSPSELLGVYSCIIHDSLGRNSGTSTVEVNGNYILLRVLDTTTTCA